MSLETLNRRPDGAYDFVIGRDGTLLDCIAASWRTGPSWAIYGSTEAEVRAFVEDWAEAGRGRHLLNGLYVVDANGDATEVQL